MQKELHPTYYPNATITCSCGNVIQVGSTIEKGKTELCAACHPFYTGTQKLVDTAGRVDKFRARIAKGEEEKKKKAAQKEAQKAAKVTAEAEKETKKAKKKLAK